ncbi:MAG: MATE family efflux transporter [Eubacteriales bacterium]|nr:MATE family efflux transporter [Eubacteriales bacterium]
MKKELFGSRAELAQVWRLSGPTIFENIMLSMTSIVDTAMVGSLGAAATAAVAVNSSPMWMINSTTAAIAVGATVMVARFVGAAQEDKARDTARHAALLGLGLGVVLTVLVSAMSGAIPRWMGAGSDVLPAAVDYLRIMTSTLILRLMSIVLSGVLRGAGNMRAPMLINVAANAVNVAGNYFLIYKPHTADLFGLRFGVWGAGLGVRGAALATAVSVGLAGVLMFLALLSRRQRVYLDLRTRFHWDGDILKKILKVGLPAAMERLAINGGQLVFLRIVAGLGTVPLAAHHLGVTAESLCYLPADGYAAAATTLVGQACGAGDTQSARRYGQITFRLGFVTMLFTGGLLFAFSPQIMGLFTPDAAVIALGAPVLRLVALVQPLFATAIILSGALRGAGDTRWPFYISAGCMWGIRQALAWVCAYSLGMGLMGAWVGMVADLAARGLLIYLRFRRGKWMELRM